jgi:hypothetical protein
MAYDPTPTSAPLALSKEDNAPEAKRGAQVGQRGSLLRAAAIVRPSCGLAPLMSGFLPFDDLLLALMLNN